MSASRQLAKNLDHHSLNEHGLSKRYVRCLQVNNNIWKVLLVFYLSIKACYGSSIPHVIQYTICLLYVCSSQISEVVNHMKDLIEFSHKNKLGPIGMTKYSPISIILGAQLNFLRTVSS